MQMYWSEKDEATWKINTAIVTHIIISLDGKSVSHYLVLSLYKFGLFFYYTNLYLDPCLLLFFIIRK